MCFSHASLLTGFVHRSARFCFVFTDLRSGHCSPRVLVPKGIGFVRDVVCLDRVLQQYLSLLMNRSARLGRFSDPNLPSAISDLVLVQLTLSTA